MARPTLPLTAARAARHEALYLRIAALAKQVEAVARTKPGQEVAGPVRSLAEDLLFEAREFRQRGERRGLVAAAPDHAGLAAQLAQALGRLDGFAAPHTGMNASNILCWQFADGTQLPVQRLQPALQPHAADRGDDMDDIRDKLTRRLANTIRHEVRERLVALGVEPAEASRQSAEVDERFRKS